MTTSHSNSGLSGEGSDEIVEDPRFRVMRRLVSALLIVLIAGTLAVVIALLLKLRSTSFGGSSTSASVIGVSAEEKLIRADATADRISLIIEHKETGERRIVILDAQDYSVVAAVGTGANANQGTVEE